MIKRGWHESSNNDALFAQKMGKNYKPSGMMELGMKLQMDFKN